MTVTFSFSKHNIWKALRTSENKQIGEHCVKNPIVEGSRGYKNEYNRNNLYVVAPGNPPTSEHWKVTLSPSFLLIHVEGVKVTVGVENEKI